jgi:hypothetical protein
VRLLDGFSTHHPRNHPVGEKGGNYDIYDELFEEINNCLVVMRSHTPAILSNIELMNKYFGQYLAIVRDIRDVVVSLSFAIQQESKSSAFLDFGVSRNLPWDTISIQEVRSDREQMIDLVIDRILPGALSLSEGWVDYSKENNHVMLIKYEDMIRLPLKALRGILEFFSLRKSDLEIQSAMDALNPKKEASEGDNLSFGNIGVWKQWLTESQQKRCEAVGGVFLKKVGYEI